MRNYTSIKWILNNELNFEPGITCRLKCGGCMMRFQMKKGSMHHETQGWDRRYNIPFEKYKVILDTWKSLQFCGNLSDPIYHPDFIETLKYMKGKNYECRFHTNGSGKSKAWWEEVYGLCQGERRWKWIFGLDGLPKDSYQYRENQDGEQVWEMMKLGKARGMELEWQWIVFKYNEDDIKEGKLMAAQYGMKFLEMHSSRWVDDRWQGAKDMRVYEPSEEHRTDQRQDWIEIPLKSVGAMAVHKPSADNFKISPDCLGELRKSIMFNSMGFFIPCCEKDQYVDSMEKRGFYQDKFHIDNLHTPEDIKNVFMSDTWQDFYKGLHDDPMNAPHQCKTFCGASDFHKGGSGADPKGFV